jgi:hypothetical protein
VPLALVLIDVDFQLSCHGERVSSKPRAQAFISRFVFPVAGAIVVACLSAAP